MKTDHLLLKLFCASLLIHTGILFLFSLTLPARKKVLLPIEVSLRRPTTGKKPLKLVQTEPLPEIPKISYAYDRLFPLKKKEIILESLHEIMGTRNYVFLTQLPKKIEVLQYFTVKFPSIPIPFEKKKETGISEEIIGPGGKRELVYRETVLYPEWAQKKGIEGNIRIKFWVEPDGRINETELLISSGYPELDIIAEETFRKWLFEPVVKKNKKVWGVIIFRFRLK